MLRRFRPGTDRRPRPLNSIGEVPPSVRKLKQDDPVCIRRGRLCKFKARGAVASALFGTHHL